MTKKSMNFIPAALAALFLMLPVLLHADDAPPPLAEMWVVTPKQGQGSEFRKALADHMAFRAEHGDPRAWQVYTPMLGDDLGRFAIRYCCFTWSDQDSYQAWSDSAEKINTHFNENVAPHSEKWAHYFESMDWGNSHWAEGAGAVAYYAVTEFNIKPGHGQDFDAARDKMSQIALNQGWASTERSWLWASTIGGKPQESIIIPHQNFASFEPGKEDFVTFLSRHLGAEQAAELLQQFSGASWSTDYQIWEFQSDLSITSGN